MNEKIVQDSRYPEWMKAWNAKAAEVDQQIINFFQENTAQAGAAFEEFGNLLQDSVQAWWDKQHMDDITRAEYEKAKADAKLFRAQLENRIEHLIQNGKITAAKLSRRNEEG